MSEINVITVNVRGLNNHIKRRKLSRWLNDNQFHIAFLQETYCTDKSVNLFKDDFVGEIYHSVTKSPHSKGVAIWISSKLKHDIVNIVVSEDDGRKLLLNLDVCETIYSIISLYAPNNEKERCVLYNNLI